MQLVAVKQNWSMKSSTNHSWESHIFWILVKVQKDIKCVIENKEETTHTTRPRSGRVVYKKLLLRYLTDFFSEPFFKKCLFWRARLSPFGGGGKIFWEARRLTSFSDVFKIVDPLSLYWFGINFLFKIWSIPRCFLEKPLRKFSFWKNHDKEFSSKNPLGNLHFPKDQGEGFFFEKPLRKFAFSKKSRWRFFLRKTP